ncbi:MAG: prepilin-type N-terminal cleavage/methylation domain-containing protein [Polyangiales bacterium]
MQQTYDLTSTDIETRARKRALRQQGMTLIEIMIVVVIMALVATGVGIAVIPQLQKAKIRQAESAVATVRSAVQLYMATNNAECATMEQLLQDKAIDKATATKDSWDHDFKIECDGTEVTVASAGPDGEFETEDDIPKK